MFLRGFDSKDAVIKPTGKYSRRPVPKFGVRSVYKHDFRRKYSARIFCDETFGPDDIRPPV